MEKYWIIVEGRPQGPFTADQLKVRRDFTADLPVWTSRLTDWTTVGQLPELASLLSVTDGDEPSESEVGRFVEETVGQAPVAATQRAATGWIQPREEIDGEKRPSSYLGWNIAMTLCCCMPAGVVGIVFSSMVNQKWQRGDVEGARKASDNAAWCLILAIVLGLVGWPFQMLFQMM